MTAEQLNAARAAHWRQDQKPVLTPEDAGNWFAEHHLSLFLPRPAELPAPAPSFVEACLGAASQTPPAAAVEQAIELLAELMASGKVVGLNLFGGLGEQPDFIVHETALPFVISLRAERNWKQAPATSGSYRVSPLAAELWKLLERESFLSAGAAREMLGRELTEAAVLRTLDTLWQQLRVIPVLQTADRPALWELLQTHHRAALVRGSSASQVTAISLLVSAYLQSVYAATGEQIETFLSPLVSRARVREAVRGLSATKQIHSLSMASQTYYFLEDSLPEFAFESELQQKEKTLESERRPSATREDFAAPSSAPSRPAYSERGTGRPANRYPNIRKPDMGRRPAGRRGEKPMQARRYSEQNRPPENRKGKAGQPQRPPFQKWRKSPATRPPQGESNESQRPPLQKWRKFPTNRPPQGEPGEQRRPTGKPFRQSFSRPAEPRDFERRRFPGQNRRRPPEKRFVPGQEPAQRGSRRPFTGNEDRRTQGPPKETKRFDGQKGWPESRKHGGVKNRSFPSGFPAKSGGKNKWKRREPPPGQQDPEQSAGLKNSSGDKPAKPWKYGFRPPRPQAGKNPRRGRGSFRGKGPGKPE